MSSQLDERIRSMMEQVIDESPLPPALPDPPASPIRRPAPAWAIAVAVAAAVLVVVGLASILLSGSDGAVVPLPPAEATTITSGVEATDGAADEQHDPPEGTVDGSINGGQVNVESVTEYTVADGIGYGIITDIETMADGSVWVTSVDRGSSATWSDGCPWAVARFDGQRWEQLELLSDGSTPPPTASCWGQLVETSPDGTLWFALPDGLPNGATTMLGDEFGSVEGSAGLWSWHGGIWTAHGVRANHPFGFDGSALTGFPDHVLSGQIWVGSDGTAWLLLIDPDGQQVLARYARGRWEVSSTPTEILSRIGEVGCASGAVDVEGALWFTGDGVGFVGFDGEDWTGTTDTSFCVPPIGPTAVGPDGEFWWATESGLIRWDGESRSEWAIAETWTSDRPVTSFAYDQGLSVGGGGAVWIPARGRLVRFDPPSASWTSLSPGDGIPLIVDSAPAAVDSSGSVWYASPAGVARVVTSVSRSSAPSAEGQTPLEDLEWTATVLPLDGVEEAFDADIERAGVFGVFAAQDGRLFLSGVVTSYAQEQRSVAWTSVDGLSWVPFDIAVGDTNLFLEDLATLTDGYLVKGTAHDRSVGWGPDAYRIEYWHSADGLSWTLVEHVPTDGTSTLDDHFTGEERSSQAPSLESTGLASVFGADTYLESMIVLEDRIVITAANLQGSVPVVWTAPLP